MGKHFSNIQLNTNASRSIMIIKILMKLIEFFRFGVSLIAICYAVFEMAYAGKIIFGLIILFLALSILRSVRQLVISSTTLILITYAYYYFNGLPYPISGPVLIAIFAVATFFYFNIHQRILKQIFKV